MKQAPFVSNPNFWIISTPPCHSTPMHYPHKMIWHSFTLFCYCLIQFQINAAEPQPLVTTLKQIGAQVFLDPSSKQIVEINLNGHTQLDTSLFSRIATESAITDLSLERTSTGDFEIALTTKLQNLEWLNLYRTQITDHSLILLGNLPKLTQLPIGETKITDAGLRHLKHCHGLEYLGLRKTAITDQGLSALKELKHLTGLHLGETAISDQGMKHLGHLKQLQKLWLHNTAISDLGLKHLENLKKLRQLMIYDTKVTASGYETLQAKLPDCLIVYQIE